MIKVKLITLLLIGKKKKIQENIKLEVKENKYQYGEKY